MQTLDEHTEGQHQWQVEEASNYTHPLDVQLFADLYLFQFIGDVSSKHVLDMGCGNAYLLRKLQTNGAHVTGIDVSKEMIYQAQKSFEERKASSFLYVASTDHLPFASSIYDTAICSLTINNLSSADMTKRTFQEAARVLKPGGLFIITLPNPHTLDVRTKFRWTEWESKQTQENLVPGESFRRQIMGRNGSMISIVNYYWPKPVLINFATRAGFESFKVVEATATADQIAQYSDELDSVYIDVPFFMVMGSIKRLERD